MGYSHSKTMPALEARKLLEDAGCWVSGTNGGNYWVEHDPTKTFKILSIHARAMVFVDEVTDLLALVGSNAKASPSEASAS